MFNWSRNRNCWIDENRINNIIECLIEAGIEFAPEENGFNGQGGGLNAQGGIGSSLPTAGGLFNLR